MALEKQNVLTKKEKAVMYYVYNEAVKCDGVCLLRPVDIFASISLDLDFEQNELEATLKALELDDYFDVTYSDKRGEFFYCINLHRKGLAFARVERAFRSNFKFKILLALMTGILTATATWGLRLLLNVLGVWK
ncbi:MAG: hypothetical protein PHE93_01335 [Clostridia bacterium]|nr:hypothetical protein [Clostridia bacterium]